MSGFNLDGLLPENGFDLAYALTGSEGTCVTFLEATLHLVDSPPARSLVVVGFEDLYAAAEQIVAAREHRPLALEGFDEVLIQDNITLGIHEEELRMLPDGRGWLMAEFGGDDKTESDDKARTFLDDMRRASGPRRGSVVRRPRRREKYLGGSASPGLGATALRARQGRHLRGLGGSAVPPEPLAPYLRDLRGLFDRYGYAGSLYGHFGQGCVHTRIDWDPHTGTASGVPRIPRRASDLVCPYGGSLSGEHGDGQSRAELLPEMYGEELVQAFREFKAIWDPRDA